MGISLYLCINIPSTVLLVLGLYILLTPNMTTTGVIIETPGHLQCYYNLCPYSLVYIVNYKLYNTSLICQPCHKNNTKIRVHYNDFYPSRYDLDKGLGTKNVAYMLTMFGGIWFLMSTLYIFKFCHDVRSASASVSRRANNTVATTKPPQEPTKIDLETVSVQTSNIQLGVMVTDDNKVITRIVQHP
jgi:hypothetical protein